MRSGGNNFYYFLKNKLTKVANFMHKSMLMFCLEDWGAVLIYHICACTAITALQ